MRYLGEKDIESLKWQYLSLSETYREYCDWQKHKATNPQLALPDKFGPATGLIKNLNPIVTLYSKYGDIHAWSFDDWYEQYYWKDGKKIETLLGSVDDLSGADPSMMYFMQNTFHYIVLMAKKTLGREPSLIEMADLLYITMRMESYSRSYLRITQSDFSKAEVERLIKKVRKILMKKVPAKRFMKDELSRYLKVYTMRTSTPKLTYKAIREELFPRDKASEENRRRTLINDLNKAKKIISNIEKGVQIWW